MSFIQRNINKSLLIGICRQAIYHSPHFFSNEITSPEFFLETHNFSKNPVWISSDMQNSSFQGQVV